jgi:DNA-binding NarL/FixJ family response regulator
MAAQKKPTHIFIVENSKLYVRMLDYIFKKDFSYRFINFTSGEDCLQHLHLEPRVIVLDHTLPGMNGFDTLQEIQKKSPGSHVIMRLSDADGRLPSELFEAGAGDYIFKENSDTAEAVNEKIENFLTTTELTRYFASSQDRPSASQIAYFILVLMLVSAGVMYYG